MTATDLASLEKMIDAAFDGRDSVNTSTRGEVRDAVEEVLNLLDAGKVRAATRGDDGVWAVHQWVKKAVLLSFRLNAMEIVKNGPGNAVWWDKVPSKFDGWSASEFDTAGFRAVPSCVVRRSACPRFVNVIIP